MVLQYATAGLRRLRARVYQQSFPAAFRITPSVAVLWQMSESSAMATMLAVAGPAREESRRRMTRAEGEIPTAFANNLCNEHFRLVSHLVQLEKTPNAPRLIRRLWSVAEEMQNVFKQQEIEYVNLTGQDYHEGRLDFENIAPAEIDSSLITSRIVVCEHPAVFLRGRLTQSARGIVARPSADIGAG